jgi:hypothetical protein
MRVILKKQAMECGLYRNISQVLNSVRQLMDPSPMTDSAQRVGVSTWLHHGRKADA